MDETFENVTVEDVASLDDILVSTQEPLSDADILASLLAVDIDDKHESNKDDSQSEVSEVLVKPNSPLPATTCSHWYVYELFDDNWHCRAAKADGESFQISGTWNNKLCKTTKKKTD